MSVNLSPIQLEDPDLVPQIAAVLRETGLDPGVLQLELTESAVVRHAEAALAKLIALKQLGVHVAIDDFGSGYSSLSYLQQLPVDTVKLDQSFMQGLSQGSSTAAIVHAVVTLAHALGMSVTAEGVETSDQAVFLSALGCDHGQGFYFSEPRPAPELDTMMAESAADDVVFL
jgi:EAL domain-containing protein (putative c-di-GMP-specific phosphodiesterase class I)